MSEIKLNLARKWRSRNFDEIIGQDLSVRMLKNSLYLKQFFPVYLFSGQRGCGKTTAARVFAAALNCERLELFQKQPQKSIIPCLECASCKAMEKGKHPDFIEIDAASHTGVDNVRYIVDSASLMPLMGQKKVYLIDEAHMLSKAAFNAFLKILEEPPMSVIFILATTDPQKIIDTVRSRCFQLFFKPVEHDTLLKQLAMICSSESIVFDTGGLDTIVKQTEGSVRDAINLLEQVRFSSKSVSQDAVLRILGYLDDQLLLTLFDHALNHSPRSLLAYIQKLHWNQYAPHIIWQRLLELCRAALWLKYGVVPESFSEHHASIRNIISRKSAGHLNYILEHMFKYETVFSRTTAKHDVLEMMLLQICQTINGTDDNEGGATPSVQAFTQEIVDVRDDQDDEEGDEDDEEDEDEDTDDDMSSEDISPAVNIGQLWSRFVVAIASVQDHLLHSVFSQGVIKHADEQKKSLTIEFSKELVFFKDLLTSAEPVWLPILKIVLPNYVLAFEFTGAAAIKRERVAPAPVQQPIAQNKPKPAYAAPAKATYQNKYASPFKPVRKQAAFFMNDSAIDTRDAQTWPKAHMLLHHLPGTITELKEKTNEEK